MLRTTLTGIFLIFAIFGLIQGDYYSANSGLDKLLQMEVLMVKNFEEYISAERQRHTKLRNYIGYVENEMMKAKYHSLGHFENPLSALKAIKRVTREWREYFNSLINKRIVEEFIKDFDELEINAGISKAVLHDLMGAARGIARLQRTYNIKTSDLANGTIMGYLVSTEMSASDCYDLGIGLLNSNDTKNGVSWLLESRSRLAQETQEATKRGFFDFPFLKDDMILENLVPAVMKNGNTELALFLIKEQISKNPQDTKALQNYNLVEQEVKNKRLEVEKDGVELNDLPLTINQMYAKTCSGELSQTPEEQRNLRCRYSHNNVPFCFIAPFKVEELNLDPLIALYHEAIYDNEIDEILEKAEDKVERSTAGGRVTEFRTSKNIWLWHHENEFLGPLLQRLIDITGLSHESAEPLQVANYGIGGHYGPHYDFSEDPNFTYYGRGNRLLTALFYINNVEFGGATTFPYLRLTVPPTRGNLLVWYNLHRSLEFDYRTKHAGCPVIKGSKWILNEWFHTVGQELLRPCGLEPDGFQSIDYKNLLKIKKV